MLLNPPATHDLTGARYRLLVVCTGNSARSIMAEALFNHLGGGLFEARSAGSHPVGRVHPLALAQIAGLGLGTAGFASKRLQSVLDEAERPFDIVLTVCDHAAASCPAFPGHPAVVHWGLPDPAAVTDQADAATAFAACFAELTRRIQSLTASPPPPRDLARIVERMRRLGTGPQSPTEGNP